MMVGRDVEFAVHKEPSKPKDPILVVEGMTVASKLHNNNAVKNISFTVRAGEIVCIAGIDGNGQTELIYGLTGLEPLESGKITLCGQDITRAPIRQRSLLGMSHIPEDRHKHGLVLDYTLEDNMVLQRYFEPQFVSKAGFLKRKAIRDYANHLIEQYDVRSGQGPVTVARSMSGGNQQKAIIAREIDKDPELLIAVQPTRGLDVGAIEYIHKQIVAQRDAGKAVLLVSLELDEVMSLSDRILVIYEGEIVVLKGYVTYVGRTSMEVEIDTYVEQPDGMRHTVNRAFFVMVAVDEDQKPIQVPELIITTEAEKARNEAAKMRRDMRRQRRENGF